MIELIVDELPRVHDPWVKIIPRSENSHIEMFRWQKKETTHNNYVHVDMSERQTSSKRWMMNRSIKAVGCKKSCCLKPASSNDIHLIQKQESYSHYSVIVSNSNLH